MLNRIPGVVPVLVVVGVPLEYNRLESGLIQNLPNRSRRFFDCRRLAVRGEQACEDILGRPCKRKRAQELALEEEGDGFDQLNASYLPL